MSQSREDSDHERLIEDYLFSGYRPASYKSTFGIDQQFAKPIEDEDLFGVGGGNEISGSPHKRNQYDLLDEDELMSQEPFCTNSDLENDDSRKDQCDDDSIVQLDNYSPRKSKGQTDIDMNKILDDDDDDFSEIPFNKNMNCNHNLEVSKVTGSEQTSLTPAKLKAIQLRQKIREQVLAKGLLPKKLGSDCDENGMIEINLNQQPTEAITPGRKIYNMMLKKEEERKKGPYGGRKLTWPIYSEFLRKRICTEKRKIWDSIQQPDKYNDEEELIDEEQIDEGGASPENTQPGLTANSDDVPEDDASSNGGDLSDEDGAAEVNDDVKEDCDEAVIFGENEEREQSEIEDEDSDY